MGGDKFLVGLRGAKHFSIAFRIVFRIFFRFFQTVFRIDLKSFSGANSFCTRAALKEGAPRNHPKIPSQKVADFECRFPCDPMERTEHHFGHFWEKILGAISGGPILLPYPLTLFYC